MDEEERATMEALKAYVGKVLEFRRGLVAEGEDTWFRARGVVVMWKGGMEDPYPSLQVFNFSTSGYEYVSDPARLRPFVRVIDAHPPSESIPLGLGSLRKDYL